MTKLFISCSLKMPKSERKKKKCFVPNIPQNHFEVSNDQNMHFCGSKLKTKLQNNLQKHLEVSNDHNWHFCGPKRQKNLKKYICPKYPHKSYGYDEILHYLWIKTAKKLNKICFVPTTPKVHLEMSNNQHLLFLWAKTAKKTFLNVLAANAVLGKSNKTKLHFWWSTGWQKMQKPQNIFCS